MKVSEFAVRRPVTTVMIFMAMVLLGVVALKRIPLLLLPDTSYPMLYIRVESEERRSLEDIERDLIIPLEGIVAQSPGVSWIESGFSLNSWRSGLRVIFQPGVDINYRMVELEENLNSYIRNNFPRNSVRIRLYVYENTRTNKEFMELRLTGPPDDPHFTRINLEDVENRMSQIDGISRADTWGGIDRVVEVSIEQDRLREYRTSMNRVIGRVRSFAQEPRVVGEIKDRSQRYFVRMDGQFKSPNEIKDVFIQQDSPVSVSHLGDVEVKDRTRDRVYLTDGRPAITFDLEKEADINPIEISGRVRENLDQINRELPPGYRLDVNGDQAEGILLLIRQLSLTALAGVVLAMIILMFFIRNLKMTLIICLAIPICVIASFNCFYFGNLTLNVITLVGLAVGVGSLIDNSIVVMENIFRYHEKGKSPVQAALMGSREVSWAILALTLTGIIVFVPILFLDPEIPGSHRDTISLMQFYQEGALAIIFPIGISVVVALMLVPMASSRLMSISSDKRAVSSHRAGRGNRSSRPGRRSSLLSWLSMRRFRDGYIKLLKGCLRHRVRFLIAIVLICIFTYFYSMQNVGRNVMQAPEDLSEFRIYVYFAKGTKLEYSIQGVAEIKKQIRQKVPEAKIITARVSDDYARLEVELVNPRKRERTSGAIQEDLRPFMENYASAELLYYERRNESGDPPDVAARGRGGVIEIRGPEFGPLQQIADSFKEFLLQLPDIRDAYTDSEDGAYEVQFYLDRDQSSLFQINADDIAETIRVSRRDNDYSTIRMERNEDRIDIVFSMIGEDNLIKREDDEEERGLRKEELFDLPIYSPALHTTIPLRYLGVFEVNRVMDRLQRQNQERIARVMFETTPASDYREVEKQIEDLIQVFPLKAGYRMALHGMEREWRSSMDSMRFIVILGIILIYMSLAALCESFYLPFVILMSIPLALIGIVWFLLITNTDFDPMMTGLGAIFLLGMLPNSAILMVYTVQHLRKDRKFARLRAVMTAGKFRLRPIIITVLTTVLGLLPLAVSPQSVSIWVDWRNPISFNWMSFARVVIGGMISSTILTLIVVPGFYLIVDDIALMLRAVWRFGKKSLLESLRYVSMHHAVSRSPSTLQPRENRVCIYHLTRVYKTPLAFKPPALLYNSLKLRSARQLGFISSFLNPFSLNAVLPEMQTVKALKDITLNISQGVFGLLGPNGAGKTTLIRLMAGIDQPTRGTVSICGWNMNTHPVQARKNLSYLPQFFGVYSHLNAESYLDYMALLKGIKSRQERVESIQKALQTVNLENCANIPIHQFSEGMKQRLGLAQILLQPTQVVLVDEPTVGLDPLERIQLRLVLSRIGRERIVILSTHIVEDIAHCCNHLAVMNQGEIFYQGGVNDFIQTAQGKVWNLWIDDEQRWKHFRERFWIVSQKQTEQGILLRILSSQQPDCHAVSVDPSLEDAYLLSNHHETPDSFGVE